MSSKRNITYKCPYCDKRFNKENLVIHIGDVHDDMIPEGYSAFRVVFDYVNKRPAGYNGKCIICGNESGWDEEKGKYNRICSNPACKKKYIESFEQRMIKAKGVKRISSTAEGQVKMLANRKISGKYRFKDGVYKTYTGTYERKALEFMDKVMNIKSEDVSTPGPIMEYMFEGKKHIYISDIYYAPYNLIIEVKDGGNNPNNRDMKSYREKQIEKEKYIINNTNFNYLRLTNNDFSQLLAAFMQLKMEMSSDSPERVIRINEGIIQEANVESTIKSDLDLLEWMNKNIKYSNFTKLKSHDEVLKSKKGSCHDQVMFEYVELKKLGFSPKGLFIIEIDDKGQGGMTHSLVYYKKENSICWFENAWKNMAGITEPEEASVSGIKKIIKELHENGTWGNIKKYPKIEFSTFSISSHKPGESLQQFIDICLKNIKEDTYMTEAMNALMTGYIPGSVDNPNNIYIVNYMQNNVFSDEDPNEDCIGVSDSPLFKNLIIRDKDNVLKKVDESFLKDKTYNVYIVEKSIEEVSKLLAPYMNKEVEFGFLYETMTGKKLYTKDQVGLEGVLIPVMDYYEYMKEFKEICDNFFSCKDKRPVEINETTCIPKEVRHFSKSGLMQTEKVYTLNEYINSKPSKVLECLDIQVKEV